MAFAGIYERIAVKKEQNKYKYKTILTNKGREFIGRLVVGYDKKFRQSYAYCENYIDDFKLAEIRRDKYRVEEFPGYENVNISFNTLQLIVDVQDSSWKTALSNVKGIYLIADKATGKLYVGAAYGADNFWQRWSTYAQTCHGNNKQMKVLFDNYGPDYFRNFNFAILEIFKNTTDVEEIQKRESYWKRVLLTREFGYNDN